MTLGTQMVVDVAMGSGQLMWLGIGIWVVVVIGAAWTCQLAWQWAVGGGIRVVIVSDVVMRLGACMVVIGVAAVRQ